MLLYERQMRSLSPHFATLTSVNSTTSEAMAYIVTYILPFLSVDAGARSDQFALVVLFVVLGYLYVNSNLIYFNPLLNMMGYHLFEVTSDDHTPRVMLTKRAFVRVGDRVKVARLGDYVLLERFDDHA